MILPNWRLQVLVMAKYRYRKGVEAEKKNRLFLHNEFKEKREKAIVSPL